MHLWLAGLFNIIFFVHFVGVSVERNNKICKGGQDLTAMFGPF